MAEISPFYLSYPDIYLFFMIEKSRFLPIRYSYQVSKKIKIANANVTIIIFVTI